MNKELASQIVDAALVMDAPLGDLDTLISRIEDETERKEFVQVLGKIMGAVSDLIFRIEREYPDLNPDR